MTDGRVGCSGFLFSVILGSVAGHQSGHQYRDVEHPANSLHRGQRFRWRTDGSDISVAQRSQCHKAEMQEIIERSSVPSLATLL